MYAHCIFISVQWFVTLIINTALGTFPLILVFLGFFSPLCSQNKIKHFLNFAHIKDSLISLLNTFQLYLL